MFIKIKKIYGSSLLEYSLLIGIIGLAFMAMNTYAKRGLQGRIKDMTDYFISNQQVGEVNPTAVSGSYVDPDTGEVIPAITTMNSTVQLSEEIGGSKGIISNEITEMSFKTQVIDDGKYKD